MKVITLSNEIRAKDLPTYDKPFGSSRYQLLSAFRYMRKTSRHDEWCHDIYTDIKEFMFPVLKYIAQETKNGKNLSDMCTHLMSQECKRLYIHLRNCSPRNTYEINYRMIMVIVLSEMVQINGKLADMHISYSTWSKSFPTVIALIEGLQCVLDMSDRHKVCIVNMKTNLLVNDIIQNKNYSTLVEYGTH